ncbi:MAG: ankyrin repeat domain-containing protein [Terracidiphilus sp.]|jgi:hypothetical protein
MPVKPLPSHPNLDHLKHQAKNLLKDHAERNPEAAQRIREFHPRFHNASDLEIFAAPLRLSDTQLAIARERGFPSWPRLKRRIEKLTLADNGLLPHHERIEDPTFRHAVDLLDQGDESGLRAHLRQHPSLARQQVTFEGGNHFQSPTLLEFVAENPIRHGKLPANIVQIGTLIIDAGAETSSLNETLGLVCSGCVPREHGVQLPLIHLLCDRRADSNLAINAAIGHGEFEAANALIKRGANITLPVAAALGRIGDFRRLLPIADSGDRHRALAWASQFGHVEIVRLLLDAGEDPNRYNPVGCHSHSTPLHQAALGGHEQVVRLLVERGAKLDLKDIVWQGTPAGWANYASNTEVEQYLRAHEKEQRESPEKPSAIK